MVEKKGFLRAPQNSVGTREEGESIYLIHLNIFAFLIGSNPWLFLHDQLVWTKFGGGLRYPEKWRQSPEIVMATEKYWNEVVLAGLNKMAENCTRFAKKNRPKYA